MDRSVASELLKTSQGASAGPSTRQWNVMPLALTSLDSDIAVVSPRRNSRLRNERKSSAGPVLYQWRRTNSGLRQNGRFDHGQIATAARWLSLRRFLGRNAGHARYDLE